MGSSPVAYKYFFLFFFRFASFFVFILDSVHSWIHLFEFGFIVFILDSVHNWIHLFEFGMCLCNKYSTVNNFNKPTCE